MKSAKEMFEVCGYRFKETIKSIEFSKSYGDSLPYFSFDIRFNKENKTVEFDDDIEAYILNSNQIRAIYQQCKELGWLEDE